MTTALTIRQRLESPTFQTEISKVLPKHLAPDRMARVAITAIMRTPLLAECDQASFFQAMMQLSQWGLEPDGRRAHLIPFRNNKRNCVEVQLIIDYKGLVELLMRSGNVSKIHADVVCEHDEFEYDRGEVTRHKINLREPRGKVYAAYCIVRQKDGTEKCEVMSRDDIESIRKRSRAGSNGPWVTDWNEMAKKTVFRRVSKWLQLSAEIAAAIHSDDDVIDASWRQATALPSVPMPMAAPTNGNGNGHALEEMAQEEVDQDAAREFDLTAIANQFAALTSKSDCADLKKALAKEWPDCYDDIESMCRDAVERIEAARGPRTNKGQQKAFETSQNVE